MIDRLDEFYSLKEEPNRSCLLSLRDIILDQDNTISETVKYGMPCFTYGKKALCYLWVDKKSREPYILMVDGKLIDHPLLEEGSRARMRILRIDPGDDLPLDTIRWILSRGIELLKGRLRV
ncbi:MAG: DUF1801 domain-containing protein [Bacteroidota bacterium]